MAHIVACVDTRTQVSYELSELVVARIGLLTFEEVAFGGGLGVILIDLHRLLVRCRLIHV